MIRRGPWSPAETQAYLRDAIVPLRLSCNGGKGHPVLVSLWFIQIDSALWCATPNTASIVSHLRRDPRCAYEVSGEAPPYRGVRGQAVARLDSAKGAEVLQSLLQRYGQSESRLSEILLERARDEVAICIAPRSSVSWDFTARMT